MKMYSVPQYSYLSDVAIFGVRKSSHQGSARYFPGGIELWSALGKGLALVLPLLLAAFLLLGSVADNIDRTIAESEGKHQQLIDRNIDLLAQRAGMHAPDRVSRLAADRLSLYAAAPGQIERIN